MDTFEPLISVVIPVYNMELYLARCLDSILANTYHNLEILCVDDGSKDRSLEILHSYAEYVIGRMGLPYAKRDISVISIALDAPLDIINSLTGKLGMLKGVTAKSLMAKMEN